MHELTSTFRKIIKGWGFFEYTLTVLAVVFMATALYLLIPRSKYVAVTVRVANRELMYNDEGAPSVLMSTQYIPGLTGKDVFGRLEAKILSVDSYPHTRRSIYGTAQAVIVKAQVAASYNARYGTYKYRGVTVQMGDWIRIEVGPVMVEGIVTDINGQFDTAKPVKVQVKALLKTEDPLDGTAFMSTTGVDPYIADAIGIGDEVRDRGGTVLAKVTDKHVVPARTISADIYGNLFERANPRKVDVTITVELSAKEIGGGLYFLDGQPLKVNSRLPLFLPNITIEPRVTEILPQ